MNLINKLKTTSWKYYTAPMAGFDCKAVVQADTEEEVQQAAVHAQQVHDVTATPELAQQLRTLIKDEQPADEIKRQ